VSTAAFDATDPAALERFFGDLPDPIDHVMVTAGGQYYARLAEMDFAQARRALDDHLLLPPRRPRSPPTSPSSSRRAQLRATLPIRRVVGSADVAALSVHLMTNTALTGATDDIDGGEQVVPG
jgi:hypothetical protein